MSKITDESIIKSLKQLGDKITVPSNLVNINIESKRHNRSRQVPKSIVAAVACFLLIFIIGSTPVFSKTFEKIFKRFTVDKGVERAEESNNGINIVGKTVEDKDIKVTINGVISDGIRTVISARFDSNKVPMDHVELNRVALTDAKGKTYALRGHGAGMSVKGRKYYETSIEFYGSPAEDTTLNLVISSINSINGRWAFQFDVKPTIPKELLANGAYSNNNAKLNVEKVTFSNTYTIIEGTIKGIDFSFAATLTDPDGTVANQISGEKNKEGNFKLYFSPLNKTDKLILKINSFEDNTNILTMDIDVKQ